MLKLSEAMRLGAMLKPQGFWALRPKETACALDAVRLAVGREPLLADLWPILDGPATCPVCGEDPHYALSLAQVIATHLNDTHRWTREQIADWIEAEFERTPPAAQEQEQEQEQEKQEQEQEQEKKKQKNRRPYSYDTTRTKAGHSGVFANAGLDGRKTLCLAGPRGSQAFHVVVLLPDRSSECESCASAKASFGEPSR